MNNRWLRQWGTASFLGLILISFLILAGAVHSNEAMSADTAVFISSMAQGESGQPSLRLELPATAAVGETVTATLIADNVENLAGFQVTLNYERGKLGFVRASVGNGLTAGSADVLPMGPARRADAVVFGAATCPIANCSASVHQPAIQLPQEVEGTAVELATFTFLARTPGPHTIEITEVMLVDSGGQALVAPQPILDGMPINEPTIVDLDVTGSQFVNDKDAWLVMTEWVDLQEDGLCMADYAAFYDVDGSGCITVADVQTILAQWGQLTPAVAAESISGVDPAPPSITFVVNDAGDAPDNNLNDMLCLANNGRCTLRAALQQANFRSGPEVIQFNIRAQGGLCPDLVTITPGSSLTLESNDITVDGYSQCGASANTNPVAGNAVIRIQIQGDATTIGLYGLLVLSDNNLIRGLSVYDWHQQIRIAGGDDNRIEGNFIGTNAANNYGADFPDEGDGIRIVFGDNNIIGGTTWDKRNIISGNDQDGINIEDDAFENLVLNNYVGLRQDGSTKQRNKADGIDVAEGAYDNRIGGLAVGERNVVSGNTRDGIEISHGAGNQNNLFVGNFIGLNAAGTAAVGNGHMGITFEDEINQNQVYRNIIVGNGANGIRLYGAFDNDIYDNFIGVYPVGLSSTDSVPRPAVVSESNLAVLPNGTDPSVGKGISGVYITAGSQGNQIYTNIIAHHPEYGIYVNIEEPYDDIADHTPCAIKQNTFSRNSIYNNDSQGIRLRSGTCFGTTYYPNEQIAIPTITQAYPTVVSGTACSGCIVEIFRADKSVVNNSAGDNNGEGKTFIASGTANSAGSFSITVSGVNIGHILTATSTSTSGNTSQFARNVQVVAASSPTATPGPPGTPVPPGGDEYFTYLPITMK